MAKALFLMPFWMSSLVVYAFVSRGFQRALKLNLPKREMLIAKRNAAGQIRIARTVKFSEIESAFVRRKGTGATLHLRLKSFPPEICILSGRQDEIEALHRRLCRDLRFAQAV